MKDQRFAEIDALVVQHDKLPGRDFLVALDQAGVPIKELKAYTNERAKRDRIANEAKRR